jgi:hypothetical protein
LFFALSSLPTDFVKDFLGQPSLCPIVMGNPVHCRYSFSLSPLGQQEFGRLEEVEEEEAACEHAEGKAAHGVIQITPSHVALLGAARFAWSNETAGL